MDHALFWIVILIILFFILRRFITQSCSRPGPAIDLGAEDPAADREEMRTLRKEVEELKKRLPPAE